MPNIHPLSSNVLRMRENEIRSSVRTPTTGVVRRTLTVDSSRTTITTDTSSARSEGALVIVEFTSSPPSFSILKDDDKELLRFPFGMRDPEDETIFAAASRECREETFFELDNVKIPELTEANRLGVISVASDHTVHVFHIMMPAETPIAAGEEQEAAFKAPLHLVEKYIARGLFSQTHITAWELAKKKGVITTN